MAKATAIKDPMTKSQLLTTLAEETGLTKRECTVVLDELSNGGYSRCEPFPVTPIQCLRMTR